MPLHDSMKLKNIYILHGYPLLVFSPLILLSLLFFPDPAASALPQIYQFYPYLLFLLSLFPLFCPSTYLFLCLRYLCMYLYTQMYPGLSISHIEESKRPVTIPAWCKKGWGHCQTHPFIVLPYRCLGKNNTNHSNTITKITDLYIFLNNRVYFTYFYDDCASCLVVLGGFFQLAFNVQFKS